MNPDIWSLPGPAGFADDVARDIEDGANVVVAMPEGADQRVRQAVAQRLGDAWNVVTVRHRDDCPPAHAVAGRLPPGARQGLTPTAQGLAEAPGVAGDVMWVDGIAPNIWPAWSVLLREYAHAASARSPAERLRIAVAVIGAPPAMLPASDVNLVVRPWSRVVSPLDMHLHCAFLFRDRRAPEADVLPALVAVLAGWDTALADDLALHATAEILQPQPLLRAYALRRGWSPEDDPSWARGQLGAVGETERVHAGLLALRNDAHSIDGLTWRAQAAVLLPLLEQRRREVITRLGRRLRLPFETPFGTVADPRDLELGHIARQLQSISASPQLRATVARLVRIRNALAHFDPVSPTDAMATDIHAPLPWVGEPGTDRRRSQGA